MNHQELLSVLESKHYRPITLRTYQDFISGVRYVSVETLGSEGFKVLQFIPTSAKANWDIVRWEKDPVFGDRASFIQNSMRSDLENGVKLCVGYDWYAKVAPKVGVTRDYFISQKNTWGAEYLENRGWHFKTLDCFLGDESEDKYGQKNPFDVEYAFNRAHPAEPALRELTDISRTKAELESREAVIRLQENFAEVNELRLIGAQFAQRGETRQSQAYFTAADALRQRVQAKLDNGAKIVERENVVVAPVREILESNLSRNNPWWQHQSNWSDSGNTKEPDTQKLEIVKTHKRRITLEDN